MFYIHIIFLFYYHFLEERFRGNSSVITFVASIAHIYTYVLKQILFTGIYKMVVLAFSEIAICQE